jgi:archaellum component FlaC
VFEFDYEALKFWGDIVWRLGTLVGLIWLAVQQRSRGNSVKLERHDERLDGIDKELIRMNGKLDSQPKHDDLQLIHNRISGLKEAISELTAAQKATVTSINSLNVSVNRIYDVEFSKKKDGS